MTEMELPSFGEQIKFLSEWADANNLKFEIQGEIGFGRECVGFTRGMQYLAYDCELNDYRERTSERYLMNQAVHKCAPENAYHKGDYVAVLGRGETAVAELFTWVKAFTKLGYGVVEYLEPDLGPGTTTMSMLLTGRRAMIPTLARMD